MKVAAVIMTHRPDCSRTIRSVAHKVDMVLCIGTHYEPHDWTKEREAAGDTEFVIETWDPLPQPVHKYIADRRTACLDLAEKLGCDWALIMDSDEWVDWMGLDFKGQLAVMPEDVGMLFMCAAAQAHARPKAFKLPRQGEWHEVVHEEFHCKGATAHLPLAIFYEDQKPEAEVLALCEAIVTISLEELEKNPRNPRYHYFLADCYVKQKKLAESVQHFVQAGDYSEWDEFSTWCYTRAAIVLVVMGKPGPAIKIGVTGLSRHAGFGDLYWILACASVDLERWEQGIFWAQNAVAQGRYCGIGSQYQRTCGCSLPGLWEGPFEVLTLALEKAGNPEGAAAAKIQADQARQIRLELSAIPEEKSGPASSEEDEPRPMGEAPVELQLLTG